MDNAITKYYYFPYLRTKLLKQSSSKTDDMGKSKKDENGEAVPATRINVHEARLRKILQELKEKDATITIDRDVHGESKTTTYGEGDHADHKLKELFLSVWEGTSDWTYYEYFKKNYETDRKRNIKDKHHPSYENYILRMTCDFKKSPDIERAMEKQQLFFSGDRPQATNVHAAIPDFREKVRREIERFVKQLQDDSKGFPYPYLRKHTGHRCHRYKQLEKDIFQYLKDADEATLVNVRDRLDEVFSAYVKHLELLDREEVGHGKPEEGKIVANRITFQELSSVEDIDISEETAEELESIGFKNAYSDQDEWFDELRFKKLAFWKDTLEELPIAEWPEYVMEHMLLAYFELNTVCEQIVGLRDQLFEEVSYLIEYSHIESQVVTIEPVFSIKDLSIVLSDYIYESNAFVDALRSDGILLNKPLHRLPQAFEEIRSPDRLFYSRVEKLVWEYLLFRLCDSCELNKKHIAEFYTPLYKN